MEEVFNGLLGIEAIKKRLQTSSEIMIQLESGHLASVTFRFNEPASGSELEDFMNQKGWIVPPDYKAFLERHNGAFLFTHPRDGGGMELLSIERIFLCNTAYDVLPDFAYPIGYAHASMICIDTERAKAGREDYLFWQSCLTQYDEAIYLNSNFSTWLDRYLMAQGAEFWFWK